MQQTHLLTLKPGTTVSTRSGLTRSGLTLGILLNNAFAQRHLMDLIRTVGLSTPSCVIKLLGHTPILGQTTRAVHLHAPVNNRLNHERHADFSGRDQFD